MTRSNAGARGIRVALRWIRYGSMPAFADRCEWLAPVTIDELFIEQVLRHQLI
jgi:hypothetical protein